MNTATTCFGILLAILLKASFGKYQNWLIRMCLNNQLHHHSHFNLYNHLLIQAKRIELEASANVTILLGHCHDFFVKGV